jgi:hypothetical protein
MQYAAHLLSPRTLLVPVVALAIGAAGATGIYALSDGTDVSLQPTRVIVAETPSQPSTATKDEAATAAAIGNHVQSSSFGKDEAATAAAIGNHVQSSSFGKDEAATAAAIGQSFGARP